LKRIAINGMGRTGRAMLRHHLTRGSNTIDIVAVNDLTAIDDVAYLLRYDSVHGKLPMPVTTDGNTLCYGERRIALYGEASPRDLPWKELGIDVVIESTGAFTARQDAAGHLTAGAHRVLIGAPSPDADFDLVIGVNEQDFDPGRHHVISNASCTTNSLAPVLKLLLDEYGLEEVQVTTVHAYTASQGIIDRAASKKHRGRAAAVSIIPSTTGADKATVKVLPALAGKIRANAIRVPVPDGSITDITALLTRPASAEAVNALMQAAAQGHLAGVLGYSEEELVSADILGEPHSGIVHARATQSTGALIKLQVWYDNEIGYANRCLDAVSKLAM
jgi:glyceraldehyde 3-phosphate dehydrogenase/glyceraldehyde-3-phosphate dehydrogenase (NAD(P))